MKKYIGFALVFAISTLSIYAQNYPSGYFIAPLDPPLSIKGTFGEIRDDHFHSGLDLGTDDEEGVPVMAAADGYISRIKISSDGYGKALYVTHPNGYVTVYGHLSKFTAAVNSYVRKLQYERQTFEMDLNPKENEYPVKQRDVIAYSGSSGSADGPHVHFEIRDEKTEEPINPLLFGLPLTDPRPPAFTNIGIFPLRENGIVNSTDSLMTYEVKFENGVYKLNASEAPIVFGHIGFGFSAEDYQDSSDAVLGVYSAELYVDDKLIFSSKYDRFNFNDTRYANAHIDYFLQKSEGIKMERCHKLAGDRLKIYGDPLQNGYMNFDDDASHNIKIVVKDFSGNSATAEFRVVSKTSIRDRSYRLQPNNSLQVTIDKPFALHKSNLDISIPEGGVYENFYLGDEESRSIYLSDVFKVGDEFEPLNLPMTIGIKPTTEIIDSLKLKAVIVKISEYGTMESIGGFWNGNLLTAKTYNFGTFAITLDTVPPVVEKYYVPADMNTMYGGQVQIKIKDALSKISDYSGKIDGKWHLFEYDKKNDMIIADVQSMDENLTHSLEIRVTDERGNTTLWKSAFYY